VIGFVSWGHLVIVFAAPTLKAIVDKEMSSSDTISVSSGNVKLGTVALWLMEGLRLFQVQ
jgi:hypothetical protein